MGKQVAMFPFPSLGIPALITFLGLQKQITANWVAETKPITVWDRSLRS